MEKPLAENPPVAAKTGRWLLALGIALLLLGVGAYFVQLGLKQLFTPWYAPALATLGVLLVFLAWRRRPTALRAVALLAVLALCALEWYFLVALTRLPAYTGPAQPGQQVPPFAATLADGRAFTDADLRQGTPTALVIFRGRW
jgi:hypothetical protein